MASLGDVFSRILSYGRFDVLIVCYSGKVGMANKVMRFCRANRKVTKVFVFGDDAMVHSLREAKSYLRREGYFPINGAKVVFISKTGYLNCEK